MYTRKQRLPSWNTQRRNLPYKTHTATQTKRLLSRSIFRQQNVDIDLHTSSNKSKGTIFANELKHMNNEELRQEFTSENANRVWRILTTKEGARRPTSLLALTFDTSFLPKQVHAGYVRYKVRPFIPNPLRPFRCQAYGHGSRNCCREDRRVRCGQSKHEIECTSPQKCLNCGSAEHAAYQMMCPEQKEKKQSVNSKLIRTSHLQKPGSESPTRFNLINLVKNDEFHTRIQVYVWEVRWKIT